MNPSPITLRTGRRVYNGTSFSPNWKGATAVRPKEALKNAIKRRLMK